MPSVDAIMVLALDLTVPERAELVARLLDSLEDADPEEAWRAVIEWRTLEDADGVEPLVEPHEVIAKARHALAAKQREAKPAKHKDVAIPQSFVDALLSEDERDDGERPAVLADSTMTAGRQLIEQGRRQGVEQGRQRFRELLLRLLRQRFGAAVDGHVEQRIATASIEVIETWSGRVLSAASLADVLADGDLGGADLPDYDEEIPNLTAEGKPFSWADEAHLLPHDAELSGKGSGPRRRRR